MDNVELDEEQRSGKAQIVIDRATLASFKLDRRSLVKFGRMSGMRVTRYYVIHNDILMYYNNKHQRKSKSSQTLFKCFFERDQSKIKGFKFSLKVLTFSSEKQKTFWLHPLRDEEFDVLEQYISFASEGKFSNDHIMLQIIQPFNSKKSIRSDSLGRNQQLLSKKTTALDSVALISQQRLIQTRNSQLNALGESNSDQAVLVQSKNHLFLSPRSQLKELEPLSNNDIQGKDGALNCSIDQDYHENVIVNSYQNTSRQNLHQSRVRLDDQQAVDLNLEERHFKEIHARGGKSQASRELEENKKIPPNNSASQSASEKGVARANNQSPQYKNYQDFTLGQVSQNIMLTNQVSGSEGAKKTQNNHSFTFDYVKDSLPSSVTDRKNAAENMKELRVQVVSPSPLSKHLDFDEADILFSSDEEEQKIKNSQIESVKKQDWFHSPFSVRNYLDGLLNNVAINSDRLTGVKDILFSENSIVANSTENYQVRGGGAICGIPNVIFGGSTDADIQMISNQFFYQGQHQPTSSTNISMGFQSTSAQQQQFFLGSIIGSGNWISEEHTKQKRSDSIGQNQSIQQTLIGGNAVINKGGKISSNNLTESGNQNMSSLTLQNLNFQESQNNLTESISSQRLDSAQQFAQTSYSNLQQPYSMTYMSQQQGAQGMHVASSFSRKRSLFEGGGHSQNRSSYAKEFTVEEDHFSDNESDIGGEGDHRSIKQHVFLAGSIRSFLDEIEFQVGGKFGENQKSQTGGSLNQKNNEFNEFETQKIGKITDYSFDQPSLRDSDLFEEENGKFKRNFVANSAIRNTYSDMSSQINQFSTNFLKQAKKKKNIKLSKRSHSDEIQPRKVAYEVKVVRRQTFRSEKGIENSPGMSIHVNQFRNEFEKAENQDVSSNNLDQNHEINHSYCQENEIMDDCQPISPIQTVNNASYLPETIITPSKSGIINSENIEIGQPQYLQIYGQKKVRSKSTNVNLTIDVDICNKVEINEAVENIPRIKDKKEFYNKKNAVQYIIPKMEASIDLSEMSNLSDAYEKGYFYLWSFQFENAVRIFSLHRETNIGMEYALIEPLLMKIMVSGSRELMSVAEKKLSEFLELVDACEKDITKKGLKSKIQCFKTLSKLQIELLKCEAVIVKGFMQSLLGNKFQSFLSFKNAYSCFKKSKAKIDTMKDAQRESEFDTITQSRFYFISGVFNIGLSMIPSYFLKILGLLGINPDKQLGYECLEKCIELKSIRSHYASLLLCIEYTELNPNLEKSIKIIKKMIKTLPQCPLFYWMAALLSWRFAKPDEALHLINKSIWNCGMELGEKASYLRFEKGWFCISQFDWKSALMQFEEISIQCMNIHEMEKNSLESIASSKKIPVSTARLIESFIQRAKSSFQPNMKIILPHKCGIALLIACCYQHIGKPLLMDLCKLVQEGGFMLDLLVLYSYVFDMFLFWQQQSKNRTLVDEDLTKLTGKYLQRSNKQFIKYEVLYFVKEITKLREDKLKQMVSEVSEYYETNYKNFKIYASLKGNSQMAIDLAQTLFLRIVGGCLQQNFSLVYSTSEQLEGIQEYIPSDQVYLLHHSHHWMARCYIQQNIYNKAKEHLKKCQKFKKCEFSLENKTQKFLQEIAS